MARRPRAIPAVTTAGPQTSTVRTHPVTRADPVAPVDLARAAPVALVGLPQAGPVGRAVQITQAGPVGRAGLVALVDRVDLAPAGPTTRVVQAAQADQVAQVGLAAQADPVHGMGISSVATSAGPRGETGPRRGGLVRRRTQIGADRCPRLEAGGRVAQSTTGATRKHPCGIPGSTSGASISSESGSRCKAATPTTPASPVGEAGVVLTPPTSLLGLLASRPGPYAMP